ncbi:LAMI_0A01860g1_1 [Lachancea mirantina]|uniref:LAMI_0A01860g1_1 n=1 Tax=Lachancea mirantina TaxID=1230905 RepID=A0A1G4IMM5_9SACH|nr:LAMI_0A01860g1_1 [Lachancea mirantina]
MVQPYFTLNTGAKIPAVGLGTFEAGDGDVYPAVMEALKVGYRHIDAAAIYRNEKSVGKAIRDSGVPREELFVTTKLWCTQHKEPEKALDQSLERLGLDYVDLYLIHWPVALKTTSIKDGNMLTVPLRDGARDVDVDWNFVRTWELVQELPATGKTKAVGVSNFSINHLKELLASPGNKLTPAANQVEIHPLLPQQELIDFGKKHGIVTEAYSPLGHNGAPLLKNATVQEVAAKYNTGPAQILISWAVKRGYVVLPKSITPARVKSNFELVDLSAEDVQKLLDIAKNEGEKRFINPDWSGFKVFD